MQGSIQYNKQQQAERKAMMLMSRTDPRPQHDAPGKNAPILPEMEAYDTFLTAVTGDIPPTRHIEDELNCARCTAVPGTHVFGADGADDAPAPQWNIYKLDAYDAAKLLEKHIDFIDPKEGYSVQCPPAFVNHYRQWHDSTLPKLVAISPLPLVLGNGEIINPRGLDRLRGIAFIIDDKLRPMPTGRPYWRQCSGGDGARFPAQRLAGRCQLLVYRQMRRNLPGADDDRAVTAG